MQTNPIAAQPVPADQVVLPAGELPGAKATDNEVITRLAALKPMDYDRYRKEEAKALGIQVKTLDGQVQAARKDGETDRLPFTEGEPHPYPVDPAQLFDEVTDIILRFIVLDLEQAHAAVLWVALTYLTDEVDIAPIAIINAPERACAKTLFQAVLGRMSYRPLYASNASLSALFRAIGLWQPTIFIDEADTFFRDNAELHGMVNAGYKRGGFVLRSEAIGDSFEPRMFSVYGAKSIAGIGLEKHLPDSTMSRGIVFGMRRKLQDEKVERMRHADAGMFELVAAKMARFANDFSKQVRMARPTLPDKLSDRAKDNWEPLMAVAECAGPVWVKRATDAALMLSAASESSVSTSNQLLADIQHVFEQKGAFKISTVDLIEALTRDDEKLWSSYNRGRPFSPRQLAQKLAVYGIKSKTVRMAHGTPKGYDAAQFSDAFARYLTSPEKLPPQRHAATPESAAATPESAAVTAAVVADDAPQQFYTLDGLTPDCGVVADTNSEPSDETF